ncbi:MAG: ABC transporter ATP-binding protein [Defluviitaleaceae bacterium]|nr:ABC transporter ATP-binding protein [Defluviitaleaceae bacterium]
METTAPEVDFNKYAIIAESLVKIYKTKDLEVMALQGLDLTIERGEVMAIIGNSGSGKSTLLNMIGGLDRPSAGRLFVDGKDLFKMKEKDLVDYKTVTVGFIWQNNARNLIPYLTAIENVMMPMQFNNTGKIKNKKARARELLELTGIGARAKHKLSQLSGGEQQRVAIALSLANYPSVLLADEPTGSVDSRTSDVILDMFRTVNKELGTTIVIVTHDREISKKVERVVAIRDGKTSSEFLMSYSDKLAGIEGFSATGAQVELAVLDRAGRLQIPREFLDKMGLDGNRMQIQMDADNRVILTAPQISVKG